VRSDAPRLRRLSIQRSGVTWSELGGSSVPGSRACHRSTFRSSISSINMRIALPAALSSSRLSLARPSPQALSISSLCSSSRSVTEDLPPLPLPDYGHARLACPHVPLRREVLTPAGSGRVFLESVGAGANRLAQFASFELEPAAGAGRRQQLRPDEQRTHEAGPKGQVREDESGRVHARLSADAGRWFSTARMAA